MLCLASIIMKRVNSNSMVAIRYIKQSKSKRLRNDLDICICVYFWSSVRSRATLRAHSLLIIQMFVRMQYTTFTYISVMSLIFRTDHRLYQPKLTPVRPSPTSLKNLIHYFVKNTIVEL